MAAPLRYRAVLFDALGTLVRLEPPWPLLREALHARYGLEVDDERARRAMLAEISYYRAHHREGRDPESLTDLRRRCAAVVAEELPEAAALPPDELTEVLVDSIRFTPYADVAPALGLLRSLGLDTAVVSNWDCSLRTTLEQIGLAGLLDAVVTSAEAGAAKPEPAIFERALRSLDVPPADAMFVGDSPETDIAGARSAGMRAVLIDRDGKAEAETGERIFTLQDLGPLLTARPVG